MFEVFNQLYSFPLYY